MLKRKYSKKEKIILKGINKYLNEKYMLLRKLGLHEEAVMIAECANNLKSI